MRVLLVGGSGMIGQGVLLECLKRAEVTKVLSVGRSALPQTDAKLEQLRKEDLSDWTDVADRLQAIDAVLFCLGVSSGGMSEADYTKVTYELTMALARVLPKSVVFCFFPLFRPFKGIATSTRQLGHAMVEVALNLNAIA